MRASQCREWCVWVCVWVGVVRVGVSPVVENMTKGQLMSLRMSVCVREEGEREGCVWHGNMWLASFHDRATDCADTDHSTMRLVL